MDASVVRLRHKGLLMVSTTDFFYPLIEDPYLQGRIACCNVLSDLYAMGVSDCDTMLMLLSVSTQMQPKERDVVTTMIIQGFNDCAEEAGTSVTGGQTVMNPWPIIGGTATGIVGEDELIRPEGIRPGHVVVLTKPLGTQVAVNAQQWRRVPKYWDRLSGVADLDSKVASMFQSSTRSMCHLSRTTARLMREFGATGATDVTGFGPVGHLSNLAEHAAHSGVHVRFVVERFPVIEGCLELEDALGGMFKLRTGLSAETSGGMMVVLPAEKADAFIEAMAEQDELGWPCWKVGRVEACEPAATASVDDSTITERYSRVVLAPDLEFVNVPPVEA
jgi:selenide, water dikinase